MIKLLFIEINADGTCLSVSKLNAGVGFDSLPIVGQNIFSIKTEEPENAIEVAIKPLFKAGGAIEFYATINGEKFQVIAHGIDANKTITYWKNISIPQKTKKILSHSPLNKRDLTDVAFRSSFTPKIIYRKDGTIEDFNHSSCLLFGYSEEEFSRVTIFDLNPEFNSVSWAARWEQITNAKTLTVQRRLKRKDGALVDVEINTNTITLGDETFNCTFYIDITERLMLERELHLCNYSFQRVCVGIVLIRKDGSFYECNEAAYSISGYTKEEYLALSIPQIDPAYDESVWLNHWETLKVEKKQNFTTKHRKKDGTLVDIEVSANYISFSNEEYVFAIYQDVTGKLKLQNELNVVDFAFRKASTSQHLLNADGSIFDFNDAACNLFGYTREEFKNISVFDYTTRHNPESWASRWKELRELKSFRNITFNKKKDGSIMQVELVCDLIEFDGKELGVVSTTDVTEKVALQNRLSLVDFTFKNSATAIYYVREDGSIYDYNKAFASLHGYDNAEISEKNIFDFGTGYTPLSFKKYWAEIKDKKVLNFSSKRLKKDGTKIEVEVISTFIKYGDLELNCSFITDVTEKIRISEKLNLVDYAFRNSVLPAAFVKLDGTPLYFNDATNKLFGYTRKEYSELCVLDVNLGFDEKKWNERVEGIRMGKNVLISNLKRKDGLFISVEVNATIINYLGEELLYVSYIDITERIKTENLIRQSNERYENATIATSDVVWEYNIEDDTVYHSKNFTTQFGHRIDGLENGNDNCWHKNVHPEDLERVLESDNEAIIGIRDKWEIQYRLKKADGSFAIVLDRGFSIKNKEGKAIRLVGALQDITKKKQEEDRLRLMESVILNSNDAVVITEVDSFDEPNPRIVFVNDAYTKMTGYSYEESIGKSPKILQAPETNRDELDKIRLALQNCNSVESTLLNQKKNGEKYWVNIRIAPIADEKGCITNWIAIERDVTKLREAEKEKEVLLEELIQNNSELTQFSYITSHNLRAPLTNLLSISNMLKIETIEDPLTKKLIEGFKTSTHFLNETLNDLVSVLIIKEKANYSTSQVSFAETYDKVKSSIDLKLASSKAKMNVDFSEAYTVNFSKVYLESIFLNLITNSIRYASPIRKLLIIIKTVRQANGTIQLIYSDNGIGMDLKRIKDRLFGLYQRFHDNPEGKGIGLYLVHAQITALGGKIEVESEENVGTTFTISFK